MNIEKALRNPAGEFESPEAVLEEEALNAQQKRAILEQWKLDARLLEEAAAENMAGGEPNMLQRVADALSKL